MRDITRILYIGLGKGFTIWRFTDDFLELKCMHEKAGGV
jgi:hypothetical protein